MSPKFLCCLPLRFGVFVISLFQFLATGSVAAFFWWALSHESENDAVALAKSMKITAIVVASVYTIVAIVALIGFIGAILRKYKFIKTYLLVLTVSLGIQLAASIWLLVIFYTTRNQPLADCLDGTTDQAKIDYCNAIQVYKSFPQAYILVDAIVPVLIQFYTYYIVRSYSRLLEHQDAEKHRQYNRVPGPVYQPVNRQDENYALTHNTAYPYADGSHSFGTKA